MPDKDNQYLFDRLEAYINFIEDELKIIEQYPIIKKKKFLESYLVFYENYLNVRSNMENVKEIPLSLHEKIVRNLEKIRSMTYEKDDYVYEMVCNLENFEDCLTEIFYITATINKSEHTYEMAPDIKRSLQKKCESFFKDVTNTISKYEKDFNEKVPLSVTKKIEEIKKTLRNDFRVLLDGEGNLGPIEVKCVDEDLLLDMYEKIKKMPDSAEKQIEKAKFERMKEIYSK